MNIEDEPETNAAEHGERPGLEFLPMYAAPQRCQRSYSTLLRAIASGEMRAKKWAGMWFVHVDELDRKYNPTEYRRRQAAKELAAAERDE